MLFDVTKISDVKYKGRVDINSLEELKLFMEFHKSDVIIYKPKNKTDNYKIQICDDCL